MRIFRCCFSLVGARLTHLLIMGALAASGSACGSDKKDSGGGSGASDPGTSSGGTTSGSGGMGGSDPGSTGSGGKTDPNNNACGLTSVPPGAGTDTTDFEGCTGVSVEAETMPADIFILLDRSSSMHDNRVVDGDDAAPTRWEAMTTALKQFISAPSSSNLRIGLQYFPLHASGGATECNPDEYATPAVPIAPVTDDHRDALLESIDDQFPVGFTPAVPALAGALQYAKDWAEANPERPTILIWAADGFPTECDDTSIASLENLAEEYAAGTPKVSTFVVGLGPVANLKRVAEKSGNEAFFVSNCPTAVEDLQTALGRISHSPTLCQFELPEPPEGEFLDFEKVNLTFTPDEGSTQIIRYAGGEENCTHGGWHYDDADSPTSIHVCPTTCSRFGGGRIDIVVGCKSVSLQ